MHEVLVNRLGGLSLPRKSVVRLTDRPDMTLDVYRGRKTTMQQQQQQNIQDGVQDGRQRDKVFNIFLSIWVRNIILVAIHRFLRSRNRLSILKFISDISSTQNGGQDGRQSIKYPISSLI